MKKSSLTTAVVAGLAGVAGLVNVSNAVNVNPDGLGQVLIYPYYTVNGGNSTLISVVNTTNDVKAVKVRFLESLNSQEVLDFNLYLSPFDVWTGSVNASPDGQGDGGVMVTYDTSCTVPYFYEQFQDVGFNFGSLTNADIGGTYQGFFKNFQYRSGGHNPDGGPNDLVRAREGHLEMIEMGRVVDDGDFSSAAGASIEAVDDLADTGGALATAATHTDGVPNDCQALLDAFRNVAGVPGQWLVDVNADVDTPNGGLFGGAEIVSVAQGTNLSYNADALEGFFQTAGADLHTFTGNVLPNLTQAEPAMANVFDNGTLIQLDFSSDPNGNFHPGLDAVSAAIMHNEIYNEYLTTPGIGASSEWVITFPTKLLHIDDTVTEAERRPFTEAFDWNGTPDLSDPNPANWTLSGACEDILLSFWDREEQVTGRGVASGTNCPSPLPPGTDPNSCDQNPTIKTPPLCFEANVVAFNQAGTIDYLDESAVLGSNWAINIPLVDLYGPSGDPAAGANYFNEGWARIDFTRSLNPFTGLVEVEHHYMLADSTLGGGIDVVLGLPTVGFWATQFLNSDVSGGVLANYSGLHKHRADRDGYATDDPTVLDPDGMPLPNGFDWS